MITEVTINNKMFYCSDIGDGFMNSDLEKVKEFENNGKIAQLWDDLYSTFGYYGEIHIINADSLALFLSHVDELKGNKE